MPPKHALGNLALGLPFNVGVATMQCVCGTARLESGALQNYKSQIESKQVSSQLNVSYG